MSTSEPDAAGQCALTQPGSLVVADVPASVVAVGNPCRVVRPLPSD